MNGYMNHNTMNGISTPNLNDERERKCHICDVLETPGHKSSLQHRFNHLLFGWNIYRKALVKNRHGVEVHVKLVDVVNGNRLLYNELLRKGSHITKGTVAQVECQRNGVIYLFTVRNGQKGNIFLINAQLLHSYPYFIFEDFEGLLNNQNILKLPPGAVYSFKVKFLSKSVVIGSFKMPVAIELQTEKQEAFTIIREMMVDISDEEEITAGPKIKSPFTAEIWTEVEEIYPPLERVFASDLYRAPLKYASCFKFGLKEHHTMNYEELTRLRELRDLIAPGYPTKSNYRDLFHIALWADEEKAEGMLRRYNMENVIMKCVEDDLLELEVPGLAEKRPSLIKGDIVNIRPHKDRIAYQGIIHRVNDTTIHIKGVDDELMECIIEYFNAGSALELDVAFELSRLAYERMHAAVDQCVDNNMLDCLFPDDSLADRNIGIVHNILDNQFINRDISSNEQQKKAVINILNSTSGVAPYIVFGPPGTGKTVTIVEAILQIKERIKDSIILVCAPANAACDMLASKLIESEKFTKKELIRVHTDSRDWSTVPDIVKPYSNYEEEKYTKPSGEALMDYRVIITTLILSGRYAISQRFHPNFVFIDEAAQAMEPEALVPVSLIKLGKQLVLAGDPKQLGPICTSSVAEKLTLNISLLERLMETPLYANHNPKFITMLKLNFRAHPVVLQLPNELFYENQLIPMSQFAATDPIAGIFIYHKIFSNPCRIKSAGQAVEFCAVFAKERREGQSPSYFNPKEVEMVVKYVQALTNLSETRVTSSDIGVVTPYIRQVYRIKDRLQRCGYPNVEVGTTETFQGREKRIIIISTVRAQHSLLLFDQRYKLGFVKNEKRFNVALTRAMSKLIIIGCPNVLRYDERWVRYIQFCVERNAYFGAIMDHRTDANREDIIRRMRGVQQRDGQYYRNNN